MPSHSIYQTVSTVVESGISMAISPLSPVLVVALRVLNYLRGALQPAPSFLYHLAMKQSAVLMTRYHSPLFLASLGRNTVSTTNSKERAFSVDPYLENPCRRLDIGHSTCLVGSTSQCQTSPNGSADHWLSFVRLKQRRGVVCGSLFRCSRIESVYEYHIFARVMYTWYLLTVTLTRTIRAVKPTPSTWYKIWSYIGVDRSQPAPFECLRNQINLPI